MSRPRFLADEDVREAIVLAVQRFDSTIEFSTVQMLGLRGTPDPELLAFAQRHGWIIVSHDASTMTGSAVDRLVDGDEIAGLMIAPQKHGTREIAESLVLIATASEVEEWRNQIVFLPV